MRRSFYYPLVLAALILLPFLCVSAQTAISSFEKLDAIREDLSGSYYLTNDIEIPAGVNWIPIGAMDLTSEEGAFFRGTLDGKGYKITGLTLSTTEGKGQGLFARLNNAVITDLGLEGVDIIGTIQTGALAGQFTGETVIERVWVTGRIEGDDTVGGIIGGIPADTDNPGYNVMKDCFVNVTVVTNNFQGGGLIGQVGNANAKAKIENVYVAGNLIGLNDEAANNNIGGIVGMTQSSFLQIKSVAIVVDELKGGTPNYVYSRSQYPEVVENIYVRDDIELVYAKDAGKGAEYENFLGFYELPLSTFKTRDLYENNLGWDFENVWDIKEGEFPTLKTPGESSDIKTIHNDDIICDIYLSKDGFVISPNSTLSVKVYNITGKLFYSETICSLTNIAAEAGLYIVKLKEDGKETTRKVLVK